VNIWNSSFDGHTNFHCLMHAACSFHVGKPQVLHSATGFTNISRGVRYVYCIMRKCIMVKVGEAKK